MSVGWAAAANLLLQAGGTTRFSDALQQFIPDSLPAGIFASGRLNGVYDFDARVADGARAGSAAAAHAGYGAASGADIVRAARCPSHSFPIIDHPKAKNFVDFDEDLQVKDLENAAQEGFDSSELLKRYSTVGMGPSQGKHSNMNALRVLARYRGVGVERLGLTTSRPMYHPVPLKLLAGRSFNAERRTPADAEHERLGAVWMPAGNWRRPEYYAVSGESRTQSIEAEVAAVRGSAGLIDVGTLGKIEIYGPQAGLFLDRVYTGRFSDLSVGMTRYGLMLDESGVIIDDGVIARLAAEHVLFHDHHGRVGHCIPRAATVERAVGFGLRARQRDRPSRGVQLRRPFEPRTTAALDRRGFGGCGLSLSGRALGKGGRGARAAAARRIRRRTGLRNSCGRRRCRAMCGGLCTPPGCRGAPVPSASRRSVCCGSKKVISSWVRIRTA